MEAKHEILSLTSLCLLNCPVAYILTLSGKHGLSADTLVFSVEGDAKLKGFSDKVCEWLSEC